VNQYKPADKIKQIQKELSKRQKIERNIEDLKMKQKALEQQRVQKLDKKQILPGKNSIHITF